MTTKTKEPKEPAVETAKDDISQIEIRGSHDQSKSTRFMPWTILIFSAINVIFLGGKRRAFGIFIAELHNDVFNTSSLAELNWIGDSYAAVGYLTTTISTALIIYFHRRYRVFQFIGACFILVACVSSAYVSSAHWLFLTHTVFHGIGSSLILSVVGLVIGEHFDINHKYHILATTLVSGGSVASIVFVQFYAYLIEEYGWRKAFIVLGIIYFFVNCSGVIFFQKKSVTKASNSRLMNLSSKIRQLLNRETVVLLMLWTMDRILTSIVTYGMLLNLADYLRRNTKDLKSSTSLTILFASGEATTYIIGAIVSAITKKWFSAKLKYLLLVSSFFMVIFLFLWEALASSKTWSCLLAYCSGFCLGPSITFLFPAGEELTTLPGDIAYPFSLAGMGMGMLLSPILSAIIAQRFKYKWFFLVQGCLMLLKCGCLISSCFILSHWKSILSFGRNSQDDREFLLNSESEQISMMKREKSSFQPLPVTEDGQSIDNGWDHIDLMDAQEVPPCHDDQV